MNSPGPPATTSSRRAPVLGVDDLMPALLGGTALGLFAALAYKSAVTTSLGQMVTPWVLLAALVGARARRGPVHAAIAGAICLTVANAAYFTFGVVAFGSQTARYWLAWTAVGTLVGPVAAITGRYARRGPERLRVLAAAALTAVALAEPVVLWGHIDHTDAHLTYVAVAAAGLTLPVVALRDQGVRAVAAGTGLALALAVPLGILFEYTFGVLGIV